MQWTEYYRILAEAVAQKSKDPSTKVGAVIVYPDGGVCSTGFNGFPRGVFDDPVRAAYRYERPQKYTFTEHAERNAIFNAAKQGHSTNRCSIYVQFFPCAECARAIIQSGIRHVFAPQPDLENEQWRDSWTVARQMLFEAGVEVHLYEEEGK